MRIEPLLVTAALVLAMSTPPAAAQPALSVERIAGEDRYSTAAAVGESFPDPGDVVYVATGEAFPDALAIGPFAAIAGAPVLLVTRDTVPPATHAVLERLAPERIIVGGGVQAVSEAVVASLERHAPTARVHGANRYETAVALSAEHLPDTATTVYLASGEDFPDAVAAGAAAASRGAPVLLTRRTDLPSATATELERLAPSLAIVVGGAAAVSQEVVEHIRAVTGADVRRVHGPDRYATAAAVSQDAFADARSVAFLATGEAFPDALAATPATGAAAPVLLVPRWCVPDRVWHELQRLAPERVVVVGGEAAVGRGIDRFPACEQSVEAIATGLAAPWDVAFTPDGRAYLSERDSGRVLVREPDGAVQEVQQLTVNSSGEGGLLGLAASPAFAEDGLLYAYVTTDADNRVLRFRPGDQPEPVLTGIPRSSIHNGGRIAFGPDGLLYVATGDAGTPSLAQDAVSLAGKVLRLTPDGLPAPGNPTAGSAVYSLGHRNVQGLAWDRAGRLFATEFGPQRDDEINHIVAGGNYGWPHVTGIAGDPRFVDPIVVRQPPEASWSGATVLVRGAIPEWEGNLFAAALRGQRLWRFALDGPRVVDTEELFVGEFGRLRHIAQALDGSLWLLTNNRDGRGSPRADDDRIIRIGPPPRR